MPTDPPYTGKDIELVGRALHEQHCTIAHHRLDDEEEDSARAVLDALAAAGRLLPEGASPAPCGCLVKWTPLKLTRHTRECSTRQAGERWAADLERDGLLLDADLDSARSGQPEGSTDEH